MPLLLWSCRQCWGQSSGDQDWSERRSCVTGAGDPAPCAPGLKVTKSGFGFRAILCALRSRRLFLVRSVALIAMVTRRHRAGCPVDVAAREQAWGRGSRPWFWGQLGVPRVVHPAGSVMLRAGARCHPRLRSAPPGCNHDPPSTQTCPGGIVNASLER